MHMQPRNLNATMGWAIEEPIPLNSAKVVDERDVKFDVTIRVYQIIIKMAKEFGMVLHGYEKETLELFMKIDSKRHRVSVTQKPRTPKKKGIKELMILERGSCFVSNGTRNKGGCFINQDQ